MGPIKILVVEDHPLYRQGLVDMLELAPNRNLLVAASDSGPAAQQFLQRGPDVVLLGISQWNVRRLEFVRQTLIRFPATRIIIMTGDDDTAHAVYALRSGVRGHCPIDSTPEEYLSAIDAVHAGEFVLGSRRLTHDQFVTWIEQHAEGGPRFEDEHQAELFAMLTPREKEIFEMTAHSVNDEEIAFALGVSRQTVLNHLGAILRKLAIDNFALMADYASSLSRGVASGIRP